MIVYPPLQGNRASAPGFQNITTNVRSGRRRGGNRLVRGLYRAGLAIILGGVFLAGASARAQSGLTLAWSASSDPAVDGYRLHWGGASGIYTNEVDLGNVTQGSLAGLSLGTTYYCAITAYDTNGLESSYSSEVSARVQAASPGGLTLAWSTSTDPAVEGYRVYWGGASGNYTNKLDAGNATQGKLTNLVAGATYYCAVTAYDTNGLESGYSSEVTAKAAAVAAGANGESGVSATNPVTTVPGLSTNLPAPWQTADIGEVGVNGTAGVLGGDLVVVGAGNLSGTADSFRFLYQSLSGDGQIQAQVASIQSSTANGCSGVMIRESLASGSRYTLLGITPGGSIRAQRRASTGGATAAAAAGTGAPPSVWMRLVRAGDLLTGYASEDGSTWTAVSSATNVMAANSYLGLAVASGTTNSLATTTFTNVLVVP
jgi:hypothetical protein